MSTASVSGTADELRRPKYAYKSVQIAKTIPQIHQALFDYQAKCRNVGEIIVDPSGKRIVIKDTSQQLARGSVWLLIDITADAGGAQLKSYLVKPEFWTSFVDETIGAINNPNACYVRQGQA
ncbi:hypothetical protein FVF58_44100 [Paraburkholderia panacisoli]|uniref:Uncharacterized protein n=1 Tax=Paraburkholderia panacisoli TaxID=2603818 RepID=A0A5B0G7J7_9BURK|nr:hypothetical protein [Paraburkholderia panacisoli]KAA0998581.1 hypothetical protein FVF58_44100 [Paraburkholderia panacisoli]